MSSSNDQNEGHPVILEENTDLPVGAFVNHRQDGGPEMALDYCQALFATLWNEEFKNLWYSSGLDDSPVPKDSKKFGDCAIAFTSAIRDKAMSTGVSFRTLMSWYASGMSWFGTMHHRTEVLTTVSTYFANNIYDFRNYKDLKIVGNIGNSLTFEDLISKIKEGSDTDLWSCSEIPNLEWCAKHGITVSFTEIGTANKVDERGTESQTDKVEVFLKLYKELRYIEIILKQEELTAGRADLRFANHAKKAILMGARVIRSKTCNGGDGMRTFPDGEISGSYEGIISKLAQETGCASLLYELCDCLVVRESMELKHGGGIYPSDESQLLTRGRTDNAFWKKLGAAGNNKEYVIASRAGLEEHELTETHKVVDYIFAVGKSNVSASNNDTEDSRIATYKMVSAALYAKERGISRSDLVEQGLNMIMFFLPLSMAYEWKTFFGFESRGVAMDHELNDFLHKNLESGKIKEEGDVVKPVQS